MEYIGFIVMVIIGLYLIYAGVVMQFVSYGFAGKASLFGILPLILGFCLMIFTIANAPFTIVLGSIQQ